MITDLKYNHWGDHIIQLLLTYFTKVLSNLTESQTPRDVLMICAGIYD